MQVVVLSIHLLVCVALIGLVLLQRSEGGALGMGGGGGGALMSGRGAADALARMTSFAGGFFLVTSLTLTFISGSAQTDSRSIFDMLPRQQQTTTPPASTPTQPPASEPARPDPTESSAPETATTQLASTTAGPSAVVPVTPQQVAPSPTEARTRAQPIEGRTGGAQASVPTAVQRTSAPATVQRQTPPQTTPTRQTGGGTTQAQTTPARTTPLVIPGLTGGTETDTSPAAQLAAESSEDGTGVAAVRRERAGPDQ